MKKLITWALAASFVCMLALSACKEHRNVIVGKINNPTSDSLVLYLYNYADQKKAIDTMQIMNGVFKLPYNLVDSSALLVIRMTDKHSNGIGEMYVIPEGGVIHLDTTTFYPSGTPANDKLKAFREKVDDVIKSKVPDLQKMQDVYSLAKDFAVKNAKNTVSVLGLQLCNAAGKDKMDVLNLIEKMSDKVKEMPLVKELKSELQKVEKTSAGKQFVDVKGVDFTKNDKEGKPIKLSDFAGKGQYVIVDFWASWCGPCRHEIKETLIPLYNKYHNKGLAIVGISVGDKKNDHLKAVKSLNIPWPQIYDEKSFGADAYGVTAIPQIMLIAPDGTIVARDLYGKEVFDAVEPLFNAKK